MATKFPAAPLAPLDVLRRYDVKTACAYLGICIPTLYATIRAGKIKSIKHGSRRFIPGSEIARVSAA